MRKDWVIHWLGINPFRGLNYWPEDSKPILCRLPLPFAFDNESNLNRMFAIQKGIALRLCAPKIFEVHDVAFVVVYFVEH